MDATEPLSSVEIRAERAKNPKMRDRDFATQLGIPEARLLAAYVGQGVTRITADLDAVMPAVGRLGDVMALTRNESCVIEKVGAYADYHSGPHAAMILSQEIDMRMFPRHWVHGFAVELETDAGTKRSLQLFDAAGDAVHKVFLRDGSLVENWASVVQDLKLDSQSDEITFAPRTPVESPKADPGQAAQLRANWDKLTDTHQFLQMVRKMKMNRQGAYRIAGAPYVRPLAVSAVETLLNRAADSDLEIMVFVGNMGCIEIHTGPVHDIRPMGPWLNVLDPGFNLHLRGDHIAEVWAVTKPTRRGPAISVEAFREDGLLIAQFFGVLKGADGAAAWNELVADLPSLKAEAVA